MCYLRIIGGDWRGRKIKTAVSEQLRPSGDRSRESLFNCLGQRLDGLVCLDLFAGSGILGLEALSRGAAHCTLVEQHRRTAARIGVHIKTLQALATLRTVSAKTFLADNATQFDLIFLDPPFADYGGAEAWRRLLDAVGAHTRIGGRVYCEQCADFAPPAVAWRVETKRRMGDVYWKILRRLADSDKEVA